MFQLDEAEPLQVVWLETADEDPAVVETVLIRELHGRYGRRPFANRRD